MDKKNITSIQMHPYLEVPVTNAHGMTVADSVDQLVKEPADKVLVEGALVLHQFKQLPTIDQVHYQVQLTGRREHLAQVHNVPVVEALEDGNLHHRQKTHAIE